MSGPPVDVAVGILRDAEQRVLLGQRPAGKSYAGFWEFPGGKLEHGESVAAALTRELREELDIGVGASTPLLTLIHHYPEYSVRLLIREVSDFQGEARAREGQQLAWVSPEALCDWKLLPADGPIVTAIRLPAHYVFTPESATVPEITLGLAQLPAGALLRLRLPRLSDADYKAAAEQLLPVATAKGIAVMLDRQPDWVSELGAAGLHLPQRRLPQAAEIRQQLPSTCWLAGSLHDAGAAVSIPAELDFAVMGPLQSTSTHPDAVGMGWSRFAELLVTAQLPIYAIGGLAATDVPEARQAGAQGVAGISAYWSGGAGGGKSSS